MVSAAIVSPVSNVPFRRFLPHERQTFRVVTPHEYQDEKHKEMPIPVGLKPTMALLSSEDLNVLMEDSARHNADQDNEALEDWYNPPVEEDTLYLPFTLASQEH